MDLNLKNKTVVITGGTIGIGRATAVEFLREGANVAVFSRKKENVAQFVKEMSEEFSAEKVYGESADVTDEEQVKCFAENVNRHFGSIDIWINNAGIAINKPFMEFTKEDWDSINRINLEGVWNCARIAASYMREQESGVIINISSYASLIPHAGGAIYAATKAAVSSLTKTLAAELAPYGVRVVGIIPGMIRTNIAKENIAKFEAKYVRDISMKRLGVPEDLAKPIVFLCSDAAGYISGTDIEITGGKYAVQNSDWAWDVKKGIQL